MRGAPNFFFLFTHCKLGGTDYDLSAKIYNWIHTSISVSALNCTGVPDRMGQWVHGKAHNAVSY